MKNRLLKLILKLALSSHNICRKLATALAVELEGGVHPKHRLTGYHEFIVMHISEKDKVLDIGCGNGMVTYDIAHKAKKAVGLDISLQNIAAAKKKFQRDNIEYRLGDATKDLKNEKFDVIVMSNVLEHIKDRVKFLETLAGMAPKIVIRVPMIDRSWLTLYKKELGIEWRLDKTHETEYTLDSFMKELDDAGLALKEHEIKFGEIWAVAVEKEKRQ